jgi:RNA-splicing ligase RtcB
MKTKHPAKIRTPAALAFARETSTRLTESGARTSKTRPFSNLKNACKLPVAVSGALMPDAHVGYGLPIGVVLATNDAVIPYAVGVDIACRMKLTVLDLPVRTLADDQTCLKHARERETRFGMGALGRR